MHVEHSCYSTHDVTQTSGHVSDSCSVCSAVGTHAKTVSFVHRIVFEKPLEAHTDTHTLQENTAHTFPSFLRAVTSVARLGSKFYGRWADTRGCRTRWPGSHRKTHEIPPTHLCSHTLPSIATTLHSLTASLLSPSLSLSLFASLLHFVWHSLSAALLLTTFNFLCFSIVHLCLSLLPCERSWFVFVPKSCRQFHHFSLHFSSPFALYPFISHPERQTKHRNSAVVVYNSHVVVYKKVSKLQ